MRLMEMLGHALSQVRSDETKMLSAEQSTANAIALKITSNAFSDGSSIPAKYTCDGDNLFPAIRWTKPPAGAKTLLIVVEDPDAPKETPFIHGIIYNIPSALNELPTEAFQKDGAIEVSYASTGIKCGGNSLGQAKYMAPAPPPGHGDHHYYFQVFALDKKLEFSDMPKMPELKEAIEKHVLAYGEIVGIFKR